MRAVTTSLSSLWPSRMGARAFGALVLVSALVACGSDGSSKRGTLQLPVDTSLVPAQAEIASRPIGRMVADGGIPMDFFLGELIVATDDQPKLDAFVARWGATVVETSEPVPNGARIHHLKLDPAAAIVDQIVDDLNTKAPDLAGTFRSSSDAGAKLLAVALSEANRAGMTVSPNFVVTPDGIREGATSEAPTGDDPTYSPNAFAWPYMNRGSAQDIGVGAAWQAMDRAGVLNNKVKMLIIDGGFAPNADFPAVQTALGPLNARNPSNCSGGNPCPWHGTMVTSAAMGTIDDGMGGAGPAAPIGELLAVPMEGDFFGVLRSIIRVIAATTVGDPKIINVSSSFELDVGWDIAAKVACLGLCPSLSEAASGIAAAVRGSNKLIFASAGNAGRDIDAGNRLEGSTTMPCELSGVICVGGMAHNSTARDPQSNFGSKSDDDSVDIYGPFSTWVGTDPDNPANHARLVSGTSFSSPFVAGVASLVWASDPSLSADQVWNILRETSNVGGVHPAGGNQRRVNAFAAVAKVLGGGAPTVVLNTSGPTAALNREWSATAVVTDDGRACPPVSCPLSWTPAPTRIVGNTAFYTFNTSGPVTVTVTARDAVEQTGTAATTVTAANAVPVVTISEPTVGASVPRDVSMQLLGSATDLNEGAGPGAGALPCRWTSSNPADPFPILGCNTAVTFTTTGARTLTLSATDSHAATASSTVAITVTPPPVNLPPVITLGSLPAPNYNGGFAWDFNLTAAGSATDPENNTPITYVWKATSFRPNSATVYASGVTVGTNASLNWTPMSTPSLLGDATALGGVCFDGQTVRLTLEATDSLGNKSTRTLPDIKVFRCLLI